MRDAAKGYRWWHSPLAFVPLAGLWALSAYNSDFAWHWGDIALGFITGMMLMAWAVEFTGNKTAHTILKEWREQSSRPDRR